jgi:hypothetical protein
MDNSSAAQIVDLLERYIALDLHFRGASQGVIARILRKSKSWVNELVQGLPKSPKN